MLKIFDRDFYYNVFQGLPARKTYSKTNKRDDTTNFFDEMEALYLYNPTIQKIVRFYVDQAIDCGSTIESDDDDSSGSDEWLDWVNEELRKIGYDVHLYGGCYVWLYKDTKSMFPTVHRIRPDRIIGNPFPDWSDPKQSISFVIEDPNSKVLNNRMVTVPVTEVHRIDGWNHTPSEYKKDWPHTNASILLPVIRLIKLHDSLLTTMDDWSNAAVTPIMKIKNMFLSENKKDIQKELSLFSLLRSAAKIFPMDSENSFEIHTLRLEELKSNIDLIREEISAMSGIPYAILWGTGITGFTVNNGEVPFEMRMIESKVVQTQKRLAHLYATIMEPLKPDTTLGFQPFLKPSPSVLEDIRMQTYSHLLGLFDKKLLGEVPFKLMTKQLLKLDELLPDGHDLMIDGHTFELATMTNRKKYVPQLPSGIEIEEKETNE